MNELLAEGETHARTTLPSVHHGSHFLSFRLESSPSPSPLRREGDAPQAAVDVGVGLPEPLLDVGKPVAREVGTGVQTSHLSLPELRHRGEEVVLDLEVDGMSQFVNVVEE